AALRRAGQEPTARIPESTSRSIRDDVRSRDLHGEVEVASLEPVAQLPAGHEVLGESLVRLPLPPSVGALPLRDRDEVARILRVPEQRCRDEPRDRSLRPLEELL